MRIFVFGAHGMLGRYVSMYFKRHYQVSEITHADFDVSECNHVSLKYFLFERGIERGDVVINCAGIINKLVDVVGELKTVQINSAFPHLLATVCSEIGVKVIHPSTDCVFDGLRGSYTENDVHSPTDFYGKTKSVGEPKNCTVIRTSIIGEEVNQGRSLVEWVKKNKGSEIGGYTNHVWNGVTCYEFAKICHKIIEGNLYWDGVRHIFSNSVTKYELVELVNVLYNLGIKIMPKETPIKCDRTLSSIYDPIIEVPSLAYQVAEMREVEYELYGTRIAE